MKKLIFTVTNDLNYDQRMIRICSSLVTAGYDVTLVGYKLKDSQPLQSKPFSQKRFSCFFITGKLFYLEYNLRLFIYMLFKKHDLLCAIDLDTILACLMVSKLKRTLRVYDAHELFCEMQEIVSRPFIYSIWKKIERYAVPQFKYGYTVNHVISAEFSRMYQRSYEVIRNVPLLRPLQIPEKKSRYILYQGAVNEGRSFETLIPAMEMVNAKLVIAGSGNYMDRAKLLVTEHGLNEKIIFTGRLFPEDLYAYSINAWAGVTLFENLGMSNYYSLANRFFDYIHAGLPQLCVNYPVYAEINKTQPIALLINNLDSQNIALHLNQLVENDVLYQDLQENCLKQRDTLNWQAEEVKLLIFYKAIFN